MRDPKRLALYARTDWRRLLAWALIVGATSAALYFGITTKVDRQVVRLGTPCVDEDRGQRLEPSPGCRRVARLLAEVCRRDARLCAPIAAGSLDTLRGRSLIRRALVGEMRRVERVRARERRRRAETRRGGGRGGGAGGPAQPPAGPPGSRPPNSPAPSPGTPSSPGPSAPPPPAAPSRPTPGEVVEDVLRDPVEALRDPGRTLDDAVCSVTGVCGVAPPPVVP